jgi:hypothetical protein
LSILTKRLYSPREYTYFGTIPTYYGEYANYGRYDFFRLQRNGVALFGRPKRPTAGAEGEGEPTAEAAEAAEAAAEAETEAAAAAAAAATAAAAEEAAAAAAEAASEAEGAVQEWRRGLHASIVRRADRAAEAAWLAEVEHVHAPALRC